MKKSEIKTGVLYAYNGGRRTTSRYAPAVVLSLATYESSDRTRVGEPSLKPCTSAHQTHGRRGSGWFGYDVGYPIAIGSGDEDHDRLLALAAEDLTAWVKGSDDPRYEGLRLKAAAGRELAGPWAEVVAEAEREQREKREAQQKQAAANDQARREAQTRIDQLRAIGIAVADASPYSRETWTEIRLTLPQVDALLAKAHP